MKRQHNLRAKLQQLVEGYAPSVDDTGLQEGVDVADGLVLVEPSFQGLPASQEDLEEGANGEGKVGGSGGIASVTGLLYE